MLTFSAALKVTNEHWVLPDLDQGVLNHLELLYERIREEKIQWGEAEFKGRPQERDNVLKRKYISRIGKTRSKLIKS